MYEVQNPLGLTPQKFEIAVKDLFQRAGLQIQEFDVKHLETIGGKDGDYTIDVSVRFQAIGVNYLTLIECKRHKNPIERSDVQILNDKIRSIGAQKGIIFSSSKFQRGAMEYAKKNGIALIQVVEGELTYRTKAFDGIRHQPPPWADIPVYAGYIVSIENDTNIMYTSFTEYAREIIPNLFIVKN